MTHAQRQFREELARAGITLDDKPAPIAKLEHAAEQPVDRAKVREILVAAGAPAEDLEWLVEGCPSLDDARAYRAIRIAWCVDCGASRMCDPEGCLECRRSA